MRKALLLLLLLCSPAWAATHYIDDTGTNAGDCTSSGSPCLTFAYATASARLAAGDTLVVKDGTYTNATHGNGTDVVNINCATTSNNGTVSLPITVIAENERMANLNNSGKGNTLQISNCSYWTFYGLRATTTNYATTEIGGGNGDPNARHVRASGGNHITFKRLLVQYSNRYRNEPGIQFDTSNFGLAEENEVYSVRRNVLQAAGGASGCVFRRNYVNGRGIGDLAGGYIGTGDGVAAYPATNTLMENNIVEKSTGYGFTVLAGSPAIDNKLYGNIAFSCVGGGFLTNPRGTTLALTPQNTVLTDNLSYSNGSVGFYIRGSYNTTGSHNSAISNSNSGFLWDRPGTDTGYTGTGGQSFTMDSMLSYSNSGTGFYILNQLTWLLNFPGSNSNGTAFNPSASDASITNELISAPGLGSCLAWIPAGTAMSGTGLAGSDVGASILYQYQNGVKTSVPLWDTANDENFTGCGAVITGVNDSAGDSCRDVEERLHIGVANGCAFPTGYGVAGSSGGAWLATDNFDSYTLGNSLSGGAGGSGWSGNWTEGTAAVTVEAAPAGTGGQGGGAFFVNGDPNFVYTRTFSNITAGIASWLFRLNTVTPGDAIMFFLDETTTGVGLIKLDTDGVVKLFNGTSFYNVGPYLADTWHKVTVEFDDAAQPNSLRAKLDGGVFSSWFNAASYTNINRFRIQTLNGTGFASQLYVDDIKEGSTSSLISTIALVDSGLSGSTMFVASTRNLQWSSTDLTGNIDLLVSRDAGLSFQMIAPNVPNTGSYLWTVTGPSSTQCKVKVRSSSKPAVYDDSETFSISGTRLTVR